MDRTSDDYVLLLLNEIREGFGDKPQVQLPEPLDSLTLERVRAN